MRAAVGANGGALDRKALAPLGLFGTAYAYVAEDANSVSSSLRGPTHLSTAATKRRNSSLAASIARHARFASTGSVIVRSVSAQSL